jgi:hypothetical protein
MDPRSPQNRKDRLIVDRSRLPSSHTDGGGRNVGMDPRFIPLDFCGECSVFDGNFVLRRLKSGRA